MPLVPTFDPRSVGYARNVARPATPNAQPALIEIATNRPFELLRVMGFDCASWPPLSLNQKVAALRAISVRAGLYFETAPTVRMPNSGLPDAVPTDVIKAIDLLGMACAGESPPIAPDLPRPPRAPQWNLARSAGLRPAGLAAAYMQSSSYTNGPTLLAAAVAFAAGYATSRYLVQSRKRSR